MGNQDIMLENVFVLWIGDPNWRTDNRLESIDGVEDIETTANQFCSQLKQYISPNTKIVTGINVYEQNFGSIIANNLGFKEPETLETLLSIDSLDTYISSTSMEQRILTNLIKRFYQTTQTMIIVLNQIPKQFPEWFVCMGMRTEPNYINPFRIVPGYSAKIAIKDTADQKKGDIIYFKPDYLTLKI